MAEKKQYEVEVTLRAETKVRIAVWASDDEDPADLLPPEEKTAINLADPFPRWEVESTQVVTP